uniref:Candidate secreted effector n=1 Tax=Meloidogyne incognita TaxID=6306 RepID=A0A914LUR6_MELIC
MFSFFIQNSFIYLIVISNLFFLFFLLFFKRRLAINDKNKESWWSQASSKSEKSIPTALEAKDKVILVPQIRQKLFTCREMSRRTVREATDSKRKFKPMKTAVSAAVGPLQKRRQKAKSAYRFCKVDTFRNNQWLFQCFDAFV